MPSSPPEAQAPSIPWRTNALLFLATIASIYATWLFDVSRMRFDFSRIGEASLFAGTLLAILVAHESGHYIAARIHKVDASLPYFLPMPIVSPFGTMGAVIRMRGTIATRRALLDIGAAGPLAGLVLAIPLYAWGVAHSKLTPLGIEGGELGESLLLRLIERVAGPHTPDGMELSLSPVAYAAWAGMFVTMINLLPVGQLDGGHVAYALLGRKQDRIAFVVHRSMLVFFFVSVVSFVLRDLRAGLGFHHFAEAVGNSLFWLVWFEVLAVLGSLSSRAQGGAGARNADEDIPIRTRAIATLSLAVMASFGHDRSTPLLWGAWFVGLGLLLAMEVKSGVLRRHSLLDHPPTSAEPLDRVRTVIAVVTLAFFALLFMPTPFAL
jgi:membrane-associated protease RseP (regulator of RpoE activity)